MKTEKEFDLSEKAQNIENSSANWYEEIYVKEFIRREERLLDELISSEQTAEDWQEFWFQRRKLIGDKLINSEQEKEQK